MSADSSQKSLILYAIWMTALAVVILWAAYLVRNVLLLIYISGLLAIGFSPTVRLIERQKVLPIGTKRFPRWLAILVLYLMIIGTLIGIGFLVVPPLVRQARQLYAEVPRLIDRGVQFLISMGILDHEITLQEAIEKAPVPGSSDAIGRVFGALLGVVGGVLGFVTILILTFYFVVEAEGLRQSMLRLFPSERRAAVAAASRDITVKVSAWLGGQLLLGGIVGVSTAVALWLMGVPFFYVLALIAGIGELIPVVGPIVSAIPAIAIAATISYQKALFVLLFFVLLQQFENHVLVPKVMERQVGVSAVTVIVALLIGANLLGILGAILAVPSAAILQVLFNEVTGARERRGKG
jgi:predicted PurR-regulated permease PerM